MDDIIVDFHVVVLNVQLIIQSLVRKFTLNLYQIPITTFHVHLECHGFNPRYRLYMVCYEMFLYKYCSRVIRGLLINLTFSLLFSNL